MLCKFFSFGVLARGFASSLNSKEPRMWSRMWLRIWLRMWLRMLARTCPSLFDSNGSFPALCQRSNSRSRDFDCDLQLAEFV